MNEKEFKNYIGNNIKCISSKISLEEINFLGDLIKAFNEVCMKYDKSQNNWNELKKYISAEWYCFDNESVEFEVARKIMKKAQELEQGKDE